MTAVITAGEIVLIATPLGKWASRTELMAKALELWACDAIEEALGAEVDTVLPQAVRLAELRARIPRYRARSRPLPARASGRR